jgi:hypothetical protein
MSKIHWSLTLSLENDEFGKHLMAKYNFPSREALLVYLLNRERGISQSASEEITCEHLSDGLCIRDYPKLQKTDDVQCRACQKAKKLEEAKKNPQEPKPDTIGDLCDAPTCNRRTTTWGKKGVEIVCVTCPRDEYSKVNQTKLISIKVCTTCKTQAYNLPNKTRISEINTQEKIEETKEITKHTKIAEPKIKEPEYQPLQYWNASYAHRAFSDGSKWCPFSTGRKYQLDCKLCEKGYPKKFEQCVTLRAITQQR